jgi:uncharacterized protein
LHHGELVAGKAFRILDQAPWIDADREFVNQAAMLHDIGMVRTRTPQLGCRGELPYVCHGVEGRAMLDALELSHHALVCERHVGVGIGIDQIIQLNLPLPLRDMHPVSVEERLICYADKFFSKNDNGRHEKNVDEILAHLKRYGEDATKAFIALHREFTRES